MRRVGVAAPASNAAGGQMEVEAFVRRKASRKSRAARPHPRVRAKREQDKNVRCFSNFETKRVKIQIAVEVDAYSRRRPDRATRERNLKNES